MIDISIVKRNPRSPVESLFGSVHPFEDQIVPLVRYSLIWEILKIDISVTIEQRIKIPLLRGCRKKLVKE